MDWRHQIPQISNFASVNLIFFHVCLIFFDACAELRLCFKNFILQLLETPVWSKLG